MTKKEKNMAVTAPLVEEKTTRLIPMNYCGIIPPWNDFQHSNPPIPPNLLICWQAISQKDAKLTSNFTIHDIQKTIDTATRILNKKISILAEQPAFTLEIEKEIHLYCRRFINLFKAGTLAIDYLFKNKITDGEIISASIIFAQIENLLNFCKLSSLLIKYKTQCDVTPLFNEAKQCLNIIDEILQTPAFIMTMKDFELAQKKSRYQCYLLQIKLFLHLTYCEKNLFYLISDEQNFIALRDIYIAFQNAVSESFQNDPTTCEKIKKNIFDEIKTSLANNTFLIDKLSTHTQWSVIKASTATPLLIQEPCCGVSESWQIPGSDQSLPEKLQPYWEAIETQNTQFIINSNIQTIFDTILAATAILNQDIQAVYYQCVYDTKIEKQILEFHHLIKCIIVASLTIMENQAKPLTTPMTVKIILAQTENILNYGKLVYLLMKYSSNHDIDIDSLFSNAHSYIDNISCKLRDLVFTEKMYNSEPAQLKKRYEYYLYQIRLLISLAYYEKKPIFFTNPQYFETLCKIFWQLGLKIKAYFKNNEETQEKIKTSLLAEIKGRLPLEQYEKLLQYKPQTKKPPELLSAEQPQNKPTIDYLSFLTEENTKKIASILAIRFDKRSDLEWNHIAKFIWATCQELNKATIPNPKKIQDLIKQYYEDKAHKYLLSDRSHIKLKNATRFNILLKYGYLLILAMSQCNLDPLTIRNYHDRAFEIAGVLSAEAIVLEQKSLIDLKTRDAYLTQTNFILKNLSKIPTAKPQALIPAKQAEKPATQKINSKIPTTPKSKAEPKKADILLQSSMQLRKLIQDSLYFENQIKEIFADGKIIFKIPNYNSIKAFTEQIITNLTLTNKIETETAAPTPNFSQLIILTKLVQNICLINSIFRYIGVACKLERDSSLFNQDLATALTFLRQNIDLLNQIPETIYKENTTYSRESLKSGYLTSLDCDIKILLSSRKLIDQENFFIKLKDLWHSLLQAIKLNSKETQVELAKTILQSIWQSREVPATTHLKDFFQFILENDPPEIIKSLVTKYKFKIESPPKKSQKQPSPHATKGQSLIYISKIKPRSIPGASKYEPKQKVASECVDSHKATTKKTTESDLELTTDTSASIDSTDLQPQTPSHTEKEEITSETSSSDLELTTDTSSSLDSLDLQQQSLSGEKTKFTEENETESAKKKPDFILEQLQINEAASKIKITTAPTPEKASEITTKTEEFSGEPAAIEKIRIKCFFFSHQKTKPRPQAQSSINVNPFSQPIQFPITLVPIALVPVCRTVDCLAPFMSYDIFGNCNEFDHYLSILNNRESDFNEWFAIRKPENLQTEIQANPILQYWLTHQIIYLKQQFDCYYVNFLANLFIAIAVIVQAEFLKINPDNVLIENDITRVPINITLIYKSMMDEYFRSYGLYHGVVANLPRPQQYAEPIVTAIP